jgi:small subunit ribosomal protein S6
MGRYELVMLIHPNKSDKLEELLQPYLDLIINKGGNVTLLEDWGKRQLSYAIKKLTKAHYIFINFRSARNNLEELHHLLQFNPHVLRFIVVKNDTDLQVNTNFYLENKEQSDKLSQKLLQITVEEKSNVQIKKAQDDKITIDMIEYKNPEILKLYLSEVFSILPASVKNHNKTFQTTVTREIKRARYLALLPYFDLHQI